VHDRNRNAAQNILVRGLLDIEKENSSSGSAIAYEADVNKDYGEKLSMPAYQASGLRQSRSPQGREDQRRLCIFFGFLSNHC
jgi:transposase